MVYLSKIIELKDETYDTRSIRFEKPAGFNYLPGHYAIFDYNIGTEIVRRSYSLSSSPTEPFLQITVKHVPAGKMSTHLTELKLGDMLTFNGPFGKFLLDGNLKKVVFVAGGSGISPFRGMLKYIFDKKLDTDVTLIYGSRGPRDIILWQELEDLHKRYSSFHLFLTIDRSDPAWNLHTGFITPDFIKEATGGSPGNRTYYICGPPVMVTSVKSALMGLGLPEDSIKLDAWG